MNIRGGAAALKRTDITGQRFGALVAIKPVPSSETPDHNPGWLVKCDCGREKVVNAKNLRYGRITSCGCAMARAEKRRRPANHEDITGKTFFELTAVEYIKPDYWKWRCSCGKETCARPSLVKAGRITSCGHVLKETAREKVENNVFRHFDGTSIPIIKNITDGKLRKTNATGVTGVSIRRYKAYIMYRAQICVRGQTIGLGEFKTLEDAAQARKAAEEKYFSPIIAKYDKEHENS